MNTIKGLVTKADTNYTEQWLERLKLIIALTSIIIKINIYKAKPAELALAFFYQYSKRIKNVWTDF